jgi:hypothetical protein
MLAVQHFKRYGVLGAIAVAFSGGGCFSLDTAQEGLALLAIISGTQQTIQVGSTNAAPLVVRAYDANAIALQDIKVDWTVPPNSGTVSATRTLTDDTGTSSVTYTPPSSPGTVQVRATAEGISVTFNLIIAPASGT